MPTRVYVPISSQDRAKLQARADRRGEHLKKTLEKLLGNFPLRDPLPFQIPNRGAEGAFGEVRIRPALKAYAEKVLSQPENAHVSLGRFFQGVVSYLLSKR